MLEGLDFVLREEGLQGGVEEDAAGFEFVACPLVIVAKPEAIIQAAAGFQLDWPEKEGRAFGLRGGTGREGAKNEERKSKVN